MDELKLSPVGLNEFADGIVKLCELSFLRSEATLRVFLKRRVSGGNKILEVFSPSIVLEGEFCERHVREWSRKLWQSH